MNYYLGIDGGGTKTTISIIDENKNLIFSTTGGPTSIDTVTPDKTFRNIQDCLVKAKEVLGFTPIFKGLFAGIGGVQTKKDGIFYNGFFQQLLGVTSSTTIEIKNDMEIALASGGCFDEGLSLIAGTGMVAYGKDLYGNSHKSGGWGHATLDLGSSFDMGFQAINAAIKAFDGRIENTTFTLEVAEKIGMILVYDIIPIMSKHQMDRKFISEIAPIVTKYANKKDMHAINICNNVANDLYLAVKAVYKKLTLKHKNLVIVGSLGNSKGYFRDKLIELIKDIDHNIKIISPIYDPSYAAALLSLQSSVSI